MKVTHCQSFEVLVLKIFITSKHTIKRENQKTALCATIQTAPQVQTTNHTCSIDSPDNALEETLH